MSNFDILIVEDNLAERQKIYEAVIQRHPKDQIFRACNPTQAYKYFETHREKARGLCVFTDGWMSIKDYTNTDFSTPSDTEPSHGTFDIHLVNDLKKWTTETGNNCLIVQREGTDRTATNPKSFQHIRVNNFDLFTTGQAIVLPKDDVFYEAGITHQGYVDAILEHCQSLFTIGTT